MTDAELNEVAIQARRVLLNPSAVAEQLPVTQLVQLCVKLAHALCHVTPVENLIPVPKLTAVKMTGTEQ